MSKSSPLTERHDEAPDEAPDGRPYHVLGRDGGVAELGEHAPRLYHMDEGDPAALVYRSHQFDSVQVFEGEIEEANAHRIELTDGGAHRTARADDMMGRTDAVDDTGGKYIGDLLEIRLVPRR